MTEIDTILQRLKENEEIAKKFNAIEEQILSILNFRDLFEVLLTEIRERFGVPYTWISLIDKSEVSGLLQSLETSDVLREHMNIIARSAFLELISNKIKPVLVNENLKPYFKLLPPSRKYFIKSMAVAPITLDGEVIGSLNQGDFSNTRFQPGMDTSLLNQLAIKVSLCLSNVTAHEKLKFLAFHDPLTGLLNRRVMESVLRREFNRARRYVSPLSLVFIDVNDFKSINDQYGHDQGDKVLRFLADTLVNMSRDSDVIARFAGDEFVLILPETTNDNAIHLMDRIENHLVAEPVQLNGQPVTVSISFGVASTADESIQDPGLLLKKADKTLYDAKKQKPSAN